MGNCCGAAEINSNTFIIKYYNKSAGPPSYSKCGISFILINYLTTLLYYLFFPPH
jgi:hypothetical protein